ncbi:MAG: hypothetical protein V3T31_08540 [candidate division Zixibacteria bacterium]
MMDQKQMDVVAQQLSRTLIAAIQFVNDPEHLPNIATLELELKVLKLVREKKA